MIFFVIIPAHNEEDNIYNCLKSLERQTYQDIRIVVVNDGSTDNTEDIVEEFKHYTSLQKLSLLNRPLSKHQPGAKVVHAFKEGLKHKKKSFVKAEVICKIDADIIFPPDYFQRLAILFQSNPKIGVASGLVKVKSTEDIETDVFDFKNEKGIWKYENIASKNHVRGPIKAYRKKCFKDIGGLRPVLGWDNIDVMLAKMHGWQVVTDKTLWVKHLRPTAQKYAKQKAKKEGEYFYNIGLDEKLARFSALKSAWKRKSVRYYFQTMKSYRQQTHERNLTEKEIHYIRQLRRSEIRQKLKL